MLEKFVKYLEEAFEIRGFVIGMVRDVSRATGFKAFDINNAAKEVFINVRADTTSDYVRISIGNHKDQLNEKQLVTVKGKIPNFFNYLPSCHAYILVKHSAPEESSDLTENLNKIVRGYWAAIEAR